jgi:cytochrome c551/c552
MFKKLAGLIAVVTTGLLWVGTATAGTIAGSPHDFRSSANTQWVTTTEICVVCHAPHNNDMGDGNATLLWNRSYTTAQAYTPYANTDTMTDGQVGQPSGVSKLCLSCHDGTVAIDSFGGDSAGTRFLVDGDPAFVGLDLSDDHPISFAYPSTSSSSGDPELHVKTKTMPTWGGADATATIEEAMLIGGNVACASCHDVDNTNAVAST